MGLATDLSESKKIDPFLAITLIRMGLDPQAPAEDKPCLSLIFQSHAPLPTADRDLLNDAGQTVEGVKLNSKITTIFTAQVSLRGLKNLIDDPRVRRIEGSRPMSPL